jgi:hypothetical protein
MQGFIVHGKESFVLNKSGVYKDAVCGDMVDKFGRDIGATGSLWDEFEDKRIRE